MKYHLPHHLLGRRLRFLRCALPQSTPAPKPNLAPAHQGISFLLLLFDPREVTSSPCRQNDSILNDEPEADAHHSFFILHSQQKREEGGL